jgi:hypothetical protein
MPAPARRGRAGLRLPAGGDGGRPIARPAGGTSGLRRGPGRAIDGRTAEVSRGGTGGGPRDGALPFPGDSISGAIAFASAESMSVGCRRRREGPTGFSQCPFESLRRTISRNAHWFDAQRNGVVSVEAPVYGVEGWGRRVGGVRGLFPAGHNNSRDNRPQPGPMGRYIARSGPFGPVRVGLPKSPPISVLMALMQLDFDVENCNLCDTFEPVGGGRRAAVATARPSSRARSGWWRVIDRDRCGL